MSFSSSSYVFRNRWRQLHSVVFILLEYFCHTKWILSRSVPWNSHIKIILLSHVLKIWDEWYHKWITTQGAGTACFFRMLTTVFLSYKNEFQVKMSSNEFDLHFTFPKMYWSFNFISQLRLMIGINFYVLCYLGRCDVTPVHRVGIIDRMDRCDVNRGKLVLKRMSLVPEAEYWYKLSIFCSLHATCLD